MGFEIGQIFDGEYPPECAVWCNRHGDRWIKEIEPLEGVRRFQIVKSPEPTKKSPRRNLNRQRSNARRLWRQSKSRSTA